MMRPRFAILVLALAAAAMPTLADIATSGTVTITRGGFLRQDEYATEGALDLFVDPAGDDGNDCLTLATACLTGQAAIDRIPKRIRDPVTITASAGSFAGVNLSGFVTDTATDPAVGAYIVLTGTLVNATLASGTATGTATGGTLGSDTTYGTIMTTNTFTVNDLRARTVELTGGTGSGQLREIVSNDVTTVTIAGAWSVAPDATTTYAIRDSTVITTAATRPALPGSSSAAGAAVLIMANRSPSDTTLSVPAAIVVQRMKLAPATGAGLLVIGPQKIQARLTRIEPVAGNGVDLRDGASATIIDSSILPPGTSSGIMVSNLAFAGFIRLDSSYIRGSGSASQSGIFLGPVGSLMLTSSQIENLGFPIGLNGSIGNAQINKSRLDCSAIGSSSGIFAQASATVSQNGLGFGGTTSDVSNCTTAVDLSGRSALAILSGTWSGTGNTTALQGRRGASIQLSSASTLTGTTEISLDGDAFTVAQMRATDSKAISNVTFGSTVFE